MSDDVVGIILAGGRSTRLAPLAVGPGGKAAVECGGVPLLTRVCDAVGQVVPRVIVVAAAGQPLPPLSADVAVIRDERPEAGPLVAVHAGLVHARAAHPAARIAVIASCDVPLVRPAVVRLLIDEVRRPGVCWAVPLVGGHPQVLVSAVATSLGERLGQAIAAGERSRRAMLAACAAAGPRAVRQVTEAELRAVDPGLDSFADIDTPADLERLRATWSASIPPS